MENADGKQATIHPALADAMSALSDRGHWATAYDTNWRTIAVTAEQGGVLSQEYANGGFPWGPDLDMQSATDGSLAAYRHGLRHMGGWMLTDLGVDREGLRAMVHPALKDEVRELEPSDSSATSWASPSAYLGDQIGLTAVALRVRDSGGDIVGTLLIAKPNVGMNTIAMLTASGDIEHFQRMHRLANAKRRPAAVLFADLEGSSQLAKRLSTSAYFKLIRRITRVADQCVIDAGGLVGRHAGDGVTAFFVAESRETESTAARACIAAAKALQTSMAEVAERSDLAATDITVRAGLHWGATLHIGSIITSGRTEVTALGDAVNEAARIEACASGGRVLASKDLVERLDLADATLLGIDPDRISYTQLGDLDTATEKARRDAPAIPVCDVAAVAH